MFSQLNWGLILSWIAAAAPVPTPSVSVAVPPAKSVSEVNVWDVAEDAPATSRNSPAVESNVIASTTESRLIPLVPLRSAAPPPTESASRTEGEINKFLECSSYPARNLHAASMWRGGRALFSSRPATEGGPTRAPSLPSRLRGRYKRRGPGERRHDDQVDARARIDREVRPRPGPARVRPPDRRLGGRVPQADLDDLRGRQLRRDHARSVVYPRVRQADPVHVAPGRAV